MKWGRLPQGSGVAVCARRPDALLGTTKGIARNCRPLCPALKQWRRGGTRFIIADLQPVACTSVAEEARHWRRCCRTVAARGAGNMAAMVTKMVSPNPTVGLTKARGPIGVTAQTECVTAPEASSYEWHGTDGLPCS